MSNGTASLSVLVQDKLVCIKIAGRANFQASIDFKTLVNALWTKGHIHFVLELSDCQLMDSTFMGVLAGLGLRFNQVRSGEQPVTMELLNASERVSDLIDNLGITYLFQIHKGAAPAATELNPVEKPVGPPDRTETARTCLEAHRLLMELNPDNISKFKDVAKFLEEDLKKLEG